MKNLIIYFTLFTILFSGNLFAQEKSRSAKSGKFVTKKYAEKHKSTTYTSKTKKSK